MNDREFPGTLPVSLRFLLRNLATALRDTERLGLDLEAALFAGGTEKGAVAHASAASFQAMDLLVQRVADLARFSDGLADALAGDIAADPLRAFESMHLRDLVAVLTLGTFEAALPADVSVDLF